MTDETADREVPPDCPDCGASVHAGDAFCVACGEPLGNRMKERTGHRQTNRPQTGNSQTDGRNTADIYRTGVRWLWSVPLVFVVLLGAGWLNAAAALFVSPAEEILQVVSLVLGVLALGIGYVYAGELADGRSVERGLRGFVDALSQAIGRLPSLLGVTVVYVVAVTVGLALFVLPGLYLGARLALAFPHCVLTGDGPAESLRESWRLTENRYGTLLGIFAVFFSILLASLFAFVAVLVAVALLTPVSWSTVAGVDSLLSEVVLTPIAVFLFGALHLATASVYDDYRTNPTGRPNTPTRPEERYLREREETVDG